jgi:hypothetical protein
VALAVGSGPAAVLAARMLGWAAVLPVLTARVPLERLVRLMWVDAPGGRRRDAVRERHVRRLSRMAARAVRPGRPDNCLVRSLLAYRQLAAGAADPVLVVGARTADGGVEGHVWVLVDGEPVHDSAEEVATYTPLTVFSAGRPHPVG